jgi:hypothetical protein
VFWRSRHPVSQEELSAYIDAQLDAASRARVDAHLGTCASCAVALDELRALRQAFQSLPRASAPLSFALRDADVRPAPAPRLASAFVQAPALLASLAMIAFLSFGTLVMVDMQGGEGEGGGQPSTLSGYSDLQSTARDATDGGDTGPLATSRPADAGLPAEAGVPQAEEPPGDSQPVLPATGPQLDDCPAGSCPGAVAATPPPATTQPAPSSDVPETAAPEEGTEAPPSENGIFERFAGEEETATALMTADVATPPPGPALPEQPLQVATPTPLVLADLPVASGGTPTLVALAYETAPPAPTLLAAAPAEDAEAALSPLDKGDGDGNTRLRVAEAVSAAFALAATGALALIWWRRRASA